LTLTTTRVNQFTPGQRALLEEHHIAGLHEGPTIILCQNCHAKFSYEQNFWSDELKQKDRGPATFLQACAQANLDALGIFLSDERIIAYLGKVLKLGREADSKGESFHVDDVYRLFEEAFNSCLIDPDGLKEGFKEWAKEMLTRALQSI